MIPTASILVLQAPARIGHGALKQAVMSMDEGESVVVLHRSRYDSMRRAAYYYGVPINTGRVRGGGWWLRRKSLK